MDLFRPDQILTLAAFLAALGLLWWLVMRHKGTLSGQLARGRRLRLAEALRLGAGDHALIVKVDDREFLVIRSKGATPAIRAIAPVNTEGQP